MTSSNKARRYLQHHKQHSTESNNSQHSIAQLLVTDSTSSITTMRKFKGKTQQQSAIPVSIPQICVNNNDDDDDDNGNDDDVDKDDHPHVAILNEFDQVLENELKRTSISRTLSLKQNEATGHIEIPINQQRSFSFALGSKTNLHGEQHDDNESINILPSKTRKLSATSKSSLSKETFSRLFQSLTFRSGNHSTSKISLTKTDFKHQQHPCLACQNYPNLDLISKNKKRPSIFGVLVSKLNTSSSLSTTATTSGTTYKCCSVCKRPLSKSISNNDDNQPLSSSKNLHDQKQLLSHNKRRQSLPSLLHNLLESSSSAQHRPSFSTALNHLLLDNVNHEQQQKQSSTLSQSSNSLTESDDSSDHNNINNNNNNNSLQQRQRINYDDSSQLIEKYGNKDDNDNEVILDSGESNDSNFVNSNDLTNEHNTNQQFLHPPEEKTRSLLVNVFRTRRSNIVLDSNDTNMVGKQLSASVINLATSMGINRRNSAISTIHETTLDQRKHAASEENLISIDNTYIYFTNINGQHFKEQLKYSTISENTTLREMLIKLFEKYNLSIEAYNICLRTAPTLPLSLDQPVKHLLLDDLVVTGIKKTKTDYAISS
ncbi:unnamed protein product [Rotaria sp. Silwood1]|nr:unnamed protein product [Rotaria sp. Silwood1]CAF3487297.1 unnamed protein product [Rotaria sp. Silwood1]CAF3490426.1 unnamed protein product [Rotaria sp. Silwood1]CAF4495246.1 unnamed protein product [Rotaria sp. Silwood1]